MSEYMKEIKLSDEEFNQVVGGADECLCARLDQTQKELIKEGIKKFEDELEKIKTSLS